MFDRSGIRLGRAARRALLPALLAAAPLLAQDFSTEAVFGFGTLGGKVDEPVVSVDGVASDRFAYRQDSSGRSLSLGATRWLGGVPDDGATPRELLPFVARRSWLSAGVTAEATSRDSYGISRGAGTTIESRLTGDASTFSGTLDGAYFLRPELAIHATLAGASFRETAAYSSVPEPAGAVQLGSSAPKRGTTAGSLGLLVRPSADAALEVGGFGETATERSTQVGLVGQSADFRSDASTLGLSATGRLLLAARRVALEAAASYAWTHGDREMTEPDAQPYGTSHANARAVSGAATWFPRRSLGVTLGAGYATNGTTWGFAPAETRLSAVREVVWRAGVRWFPRPRASVALTLSRATTDTVTPPDAASFLRLRATDDRAALEAALRF